MLNELKGETNRIFQPLPYSKLYWILLCYGSSYEPYAHQIKLTLLTLGRTYAYNGAVFGQTGVPK